MRARPLLAPNLILRALALAGCALLLASCGELESDASKYPQDPWDSSQPPGPGDDAYYPPEEPTPEFRFLTPKAGRDYVFVPNETLDTVSKIDADALTVTSIPVGERPTRLEAVDGLNMALVLNQDANNVAIIRADLPDAQGNLDDQVTFLPVEPAFNLLAMAPDGRHAFAFFSFAAHEAGEPVGNLQTVSLIRLEDGAEASFSLSVGFQVRKIIFRQDPEAGSLPRISHAYIVTDTGISEVRLDAIMADQILPVLPVSPHPLDAPLDREVQLTPSGHFALVRDLGRAELTIVRLSDGTMQTIPIAMPATDLDVFPAKDGALPEDDRALVVIRGTNEVILLHVAQAFADPEALDYLDTGSALKGLAVISPDGRYALFYTTLSGGDRLSILDFQDLAAGPRVLPLSKGITAVLIAPDSRYALALHPREAIQSGDNSTVRFIRQHPAYSLVDIATGFTSLVLTQEPVYDLTFWSGELGSFAYVAFNEDQSRTYAVDVVDLSTFLTSTLEMGSPPTHLGRIFGRSRIWINQEHPVGRMTFIDVLTSTPRTLTGFELNRMIK